MPVQWLTDVERDRYRCFPAEILEADLITFFTLTKADWEVALVHLGDENRLGFALQLCALRYLGFLPDRLSDAPAPAVAYLSRQLGVAPHSLARYGKRTRTRTDHAMEVGTYLGYGRFTSQERQATAAWLADRALEHDRPATLLQLVCERLHARKIIRPGITFLERMVAGARQPAGHYFFGTDGGWRPPGG